VRVIQSYRNWRKEKIDAKVAALHEFGLTAFDLPSMFVLRPNDQAAKQFRARIIDLRERHQPEAEDYEIEALAELLSSESRQFADQQRHSVDSVLEELTDSLSGMLQQLSTAVDDTNSRAGEIGQIKSYLQEAEGATSLDEAKKKISAGLAGIQNLVAKEMERQTQLRAGHQRYNEQLRQRLDRLEQENRTDALTGISNRAGIDRHLKMVADHARTNGSRSTVAMVDLDRFKEINDALGHLAGDTALAAFAQRLRAAVGNGVFVGRLGGDEFLVISPADPALLERMLYRLNEQLVDRPIMFERVALDLKCSFGIQVMEAGWEPGQVLKAADTRLYEHKRRATTLRTA